MRQAALIYNPSSGRRQSRQLLPDVRRALREQGFAVRALPTAAPHDATRLAREVRTEVEVVFAMGGDGTLRETAAGLLGGDAALGILPSGTANVLALALGLPRAALEAARAAGSFVPRPFDVGRCAGVPFLMMASAGLDAVVMAGQSPLLKRWLGRGSLAWEGLRRWWSYGYPEIEIRVDSRRLGGSLFSANNISLYGGAFQIAPGARFDDGLLDLVLFEGRGRRATLSFARDLLAGRHLERDDVELLRVDRFEVRRSERLTVQLDGDVLSLDPPIEIAVERGALRVLAPAPPISRCA